MSLENIKNAIHQGVNELFATAAVDEMAGDTAAHREKLKAIAQIAATLGIETEITYAEINLKTQGGNDDEGLQDTT
jgi:hypothetical protein